MYIACKKKKNKKIRKNEPVQDTGTKLKLEINEVSGESTGRANRSAKRVQTPTKGSRGRTQVQELTRYRKPGATAAKPRDTRSARKADRKYTEGQQNKSQTHQEPMKGEVGTGQPTAEEARRRDGEPPTCRGSRVVPMGDPENDVTTHRAVDKTRVSHTQTRSPRGAARAVKTRGRKCQDRTQAGQKVQRLAKTTHQCMQDARAQEGCAQLGCQTETHRSKGKKSWAVAGQTKGQQTTGPEVSQRERKAQKQ